MCLRRDSQSVWVAFFPQTFKCNPKDSGLVLCAVKARMMERTQNPSAEDKEKITQANINKRKRSTNDLYSNLFICYS